MLGQPVLCFNVCRVYSSITMFSPCQCLCADGYDLVFPAGCVASASHTTFCPAEAVIMGPNQQSVVISDHFPTPATEDDGELYPSFGECQFPYTGLASAICPANASWTLTEDCQHKYVCDDRRLCICKEDLATLTCQDRNTSIIPPPAAVPAWANVMYIGKNKITRVPSRSFAGLSLSTIDLSFNLITEVAPDAFAGLNNLRILLLGANPLTALPETMLRPISKLQTLSLSFNPITNLTRAFFEPVPNLISL